MSFGLAWYDLLTEIVNVGERVSPRGMPIMELMNAQLCVDDMTRNVLVSPKRNLNYRFMLAEWMWIRQGSDRLEDIMKYNKQMLAYSDDGKTLAGAYGPRLASQWGPIRHKLANDHDTRQAVANIFHGADIMVPTKDVPCTLTLQYMIRNDHLHCTVNMRSSDIWLGLPYDFFNFSMLAMEMARSLFIEPGSLTFNLASSHLYVTNLDQAMEILDEPDVKTVTSSLKHGVEPYRRALETRTSADALEVLRGIEPHESR